MCGIAGYIGTSDVGDASVNATLKLMDRRGPDGKGVYSKQLSDGRQVCLLHSRLSIIDLDERASQPMRLDGKVISFNGEIYNYKEIRKALESRGSVFSTESDTEVALTALARDGLDSLDGMEGMWAFAFFDESTETLVLSRDRFAEKPLYLFRDHTGLYFASEIKFLSALSGTSFTANIEQIQRYLVYGYKFLHKHTANFYNEIDELASGSCLRLTANGRQDEFRYWNPEVEEDASMNRREAVLGVRERLIRSMELRLRADVPLAFCMSGGVDSNSLISIAKNVFGHDVHGFTIVNTDERYAEKDLVDAVVRQQNLKHTAIPLRTDGFIENMRTLVRQHDAPVYTISYYVHWLLMESVAKHGYKISISGTGADELFTGYYDHHNLYLAAMHGAFGGEYERALENWKAYIKPIVRNPFLQDPEVFIKNPYLRDQLSVGADQFRSYLVDGFSEEYKESVYTGELLRNRMLNELFHEVVPIILHEDDINAMYYSIENRSPFMDRELMEFCYSIPTKHLINDGFNKSVLRESMQGIVPNEILKERRKVGFNAPVMELLDVNAPGVRHEVLKDSPIYDIVQRSAIEKLLDVDVLPNSQSKFLFSFLGCKMFLEANN